MVLIVIILLVGLTVMSVFVPRTLDPATGKISIFGGMGSGTPTPPPTVPDPANAGEEIIIESK